MTFKLANNVKESTSSTGTTDFQLGGAYGLGAKTFAASIGNNNTTFYCSKDPVTGDWEEGLGTIVTGAPNVLQRTTVTSNSLGTTAKIAFANSPIVWCGLPAEKAVTLDGSGNLTLPTSTLLGIGMSPTNILDITQNQNAASLISILNNNSGTGASVGIQLLTGTDTFAITQNGLNATGGNGARFSTISTTYGLALDTINSRPIIVQIGGAEAARFDTSGNLTIGNSTTGGWTGVTRLSAQSPNSGAVGALSGWNSSINGGGWALHLRVDSTANNIAQFSYNSSTVVGTITTNGTSTAYNTSSSELIKDDITSMDISLALGMVRAYGRAAASYTHKTDGSIGHGFVVERLSEELAALGHDAHALGFVHMPKVSKNGHIPGMDYAKATPFLSVIVNDHEDRLAALEAKLSQKVA